MRDIKRGSKHTGSSKVPGIGSFHTNSMQATRDLPDTPHHSSTEKFMSRKSCYGLVLALSIEVGRRL